MTDEELRAEVREWLALHWDRDRGTARGDPTDDANGWLGRVFEGRWSAPAWPEEYGGRGATDALA